MASFGDYNRVNTNVTAMDAQLSLNKINKDLGVSRLRLSTGFKINNAEDDAAGFAIATKLKSRVAGLEQAMQNVSDAKSVLGVVEGAYGSIMDNLIEMKSLATQAGNETLGSTERGYVADQIEALANDINDIAASTTYQGIKLLDGGDTTTLTATTNTGTKDLTFQVGEGVNDVLTVNLNAVGTGTLFGKITAAADDVTDADTDLTTTADAFDLKQMTASATHGGDTTDTGYYGDLVVAANPASSDFREFMTDVDTAIGRLNGYMNDVGIQQRSLSGKEVNLTEAITANSAAKSRIMDTDFAKEQSNSIRLQILQQTATAALSQANMGPQAVLGFLG
jgi:flagellin